MLDKVTTSDGLQSVKIVGQDVEAVIGCTQFINWFDNFDHQKMLMELINVQSVDIFENHKVVFVKIAVYARDRQTGRLLPGIVFLRGDAVTIFTLVVCKETGEIFVVLVRQPRIAMGCHAFLEAPAGMLDKDDGLTGRAIAEMAEETSLKIAATELIQLGTFAPSTGGCDEKITCFCVVKHLPQAAIAKILNQTHGLANEFEQIHLNLLPVTDFVAQLKDNILIDSKIFMPIMFMLLQKSPATVIQVLQSMIKH